MEDWKARPPIRYEIPDGPLENIKVFSQNVRSVYKQMDIQNKDIERFIYFLNQITLHVKVYNQRINTFISTFSAAELDEISDLRLSPDEYLMVVPGPAFLFTCYPFICICDYVQDSHSYVLHKYVNVERNHVRKDVSGKERRMDTFTDLCNAYLLIHPFCRRINFRMGHQDVQTNEWTGYGFKVVPFMRNGKIVPYLPSEEHRCLWCGRKLYDEWTTVEKEINWIDEDGNPHTEKQIVKELNKAKTGRLQYYCNDTDSTSCKQKDIQFRKSIREMFRNIGNREYEVRYLYYLYVLSNGRSGEVVREIDVDDVTLMDIWKDYKLGNIPHQIIMSWLRGPCRKCGRPIPLDKPMHTEYCCDACSNKGRKKKYSDSHKKVKM